MVAEVSFKSMTDGPEIILGALLSTEKAKVVPDEPLSISLGVILKKTVESSKSFKSDLESQQKL